MIDVDREIKKLELIQCFVVQIGGHPAAVIEDIYFEKALDLARRLAAENHELKNENIELKSRLSHLG